VDESDWRMWAPEVHLLYGKWVIVHTSPSPVKGANLSGANFSRANLCKIEIDASKIQKRIDSVGTRIEALEAGVKDFEKIIEQEEAIISELNQKYKTYETDVQINLERISKSKEKLRSVKTNKEYQSSLKEIEDLEAINSKIEDEMLEFLDHIENAEKKLGDVKSDYSAKLEQANAEKSEILEEADQGKKELTELNIRRNDISRGIESELLQKFTETIQCIH